jgi:hypothetical protein
MGRADRVAGLALAALAAAIAAECLRYPVGTLRQPGPALFPLGLALALAGFGILTAVAGGRGVGLRGLGWGEWRHAAAILGAAAFAALALERLGYRLTIAVLLAFLLGAVERRGVLVTAAVALGLAFGSFYLFDVLLRVPLPRGPFGL